MGSKKKRYFTKRILVSQSKQAFKEAYEEAMELIGYVVVAKDGWVVKEFKDGTIQKIEKVDTSSKNQELILD